LADIHIEEFYKDLAKILLHLHNAFPRKSQIFVEDISGIDHPDEYGLHSTRHQSCFSAMLWLADEGFIRFEDTIRQEAIDQAVLTQKAFIRLNRLACLPAHPGLSQTSPSSQPSPSSQTSPSSHTSSTLNKSAALSNSSARNSGNANQAETSQGENSHFGEHITGEPLTNVQLIRHTLRAATSTRLAFVLEKILFGNQQKP
jgi:hypothetical protein